MILRTVALPLRWRPVGKATLCRIVATSTQPVVAVASADSCSIAAAAGQMLTIPDGARPTAGHGRAADGVRNTIRKTTGKVLSDAAPSAGRRRGLDSLVAGPLTWLPGRSRGCRAAHVVAGGHRQVLRREPAASRRPEKLGRFEMAGH